ncbi:MAG: hypothetical protein ACETWR_12920 [Anaerolineae bacterium]
MNGFSYPKGNIITIIAITVLVALGLSLLWLPLPADAGPALQPPRPTLPSGPPGGEPGGEGGEGEPGGLTGTTLHGLVVNWNYHNEPHAKVRLKGGGWDLETLSDDNGYYYFKGLGTDNVLLNLALPEGSDRTPMTTDLALRLKGRGQLVVNLGLYTGPTTPGLPVDISMSVEPESAVQGDAVLYTIQATNSLPHGISQVLVTDCLPEGLVPVEATVSHSTVEIWNNLIIADIGEMAAGDTAVVTIEARVADNVPPGMVIQNRASFIYAESVAVQAVASLTIGGVGPTGTPAAETPAMAVVAAAETLTIAATLAEGAPTVTATLPATETLGMVVTATVTAAPEAPGDLPVTGFGLPIAGVLFALLILLARQLRPKPVDET